MTIQQNPHNQNTLLKPFVLGSTPQMKYFVIYYLYTMYQSGDENLDLDSQ